MLGSISSHVSVYSTSPQSLVAPNPGTIALTIPPTVPTTLSALEDYGMPVRARNRRGQLVAIPEVSNLRKRAASRQLDIVMEAPQRVRNESPAEVQGSEWQSKVPINLQIALCEIAEMEISRLRGNGTLTVKQYNPKKWNVYKKWIPAELVVDEKLHGAAISISRALTAGQKRAPSGEDVRRPVSNDPTWEEKCSFCRLNGFSLGDYRITEKDVKEILALPPDEIRTALEVRFRFFQRRLYLLVAKIVSGDASTWHRIVAYGYARYEDLSRFRNWLVKTLSEKSTCKLIKGYFYEKDPKPKSREMRYRKIIEKDYALLKKRLYIDRSV